MVIELVERYECTASRYSVMNVLLVTCILGFDSSWDTCCVYNVFLIIVIILLLIFFTTLKFVNYDNLRGPERKLYSLIYIIYILTIFFYIAE